MLPQDEQCSNFLWSDSLLVGASSVVSGRCDLPCREL